MTKKKSGIRYSLKWAKEFCSEVGKGNTVKDIVDKWQPLGRSPAYQTVWSWRSKYGEFRTLLTEAYESKIMLWSDELEKLSKETTPMFDTPAQYASYRDDRKTRIQTLQYNIAKLAPVFNKEFTTSTKLDVKGIETPKIAVISYATPDVSSKEPKGSKK